jgi:vacuolar-type H+-ATPase subunit I/STV1
MNIKKTADFEELCQYRETLDEEGIIKHDQRLRNAKVALELIIHEEEQAYRKVTKQMEKLEAKRQKCNARNQSLRENLSMCEYFLNQDKNADKNI